MRSIESEGVTIDEAIERALATLRVTRDQVEVDILHDAARGLLGFGGRRARVRATVRGQVSLVSDESRDVSRETSRPATSESGNLGGELAAILRTVVGYLEPDCSVEPAPGGEPGTLTLTVDGASSGLVIGRRGQTLDALEYLINRIASRRPGGEGLRIRIDVERYRERRQESLEQLARRLAAKAKESGRIVTLNPLSPRDRRIVHLILEPDPGVSTRSEGDGHFRKVLIVPEGARGRSDRRL
jgi:spoIIIJ-associated protein